MSTLWTYLDVIVEVKDLVYLLHATGRGEVDEGDVWKVLSCILRFCGRSNIPLRTIDHVHDRMDIPMRTPA